MWKWRPVESLEIQPQDFHPSPRPWKSLRDSHIPTRATISLIICRGTQDQTSEKCYPCSRIEVLPMFPAGQAVFFSRLILALFASTAAAASFSHRLHLTLKSD